MQATQQLNLGLTDDNHTCKTANMLIYTSEVTAAWAAVAPEYEAS
jgi:hypothetical protein